MGLGGNFLTQRLILERLDRAQFNPIIVSPIEGVALAEFRKIGIECVVIPPSRNLDRYGRALLREGILERLKNSMALFRYNLKIARFLRAKKIDIVYANCIRAEMSIGLAARVSRVPSLLYIKGALNNPIIDFLSLFVANRILFMCRNNAELKYGKIIRHFRSKISILEGGLDPVKLDLAFNADKSKWMSELCINRENFNVCVIGQIWQLKGQHVVLEALSKIVNHTKRVRLYLVGDTIIKEHEWYMQTLKSSLIKLGLSDFVSFLGWRNDALNIMSCMDLLINPSFSEGFGYVPLEAMGLGLPVIATKVGVLPEAIEDGITGFIVEPGDVESIIRCWRALLLDPELCKRMGQRGREKVFSQYLIDDKVTRLAQIWADMAGRRS